MPSFKPIVGPAPQVLVLGSMPSTTSLKIQQYYAHPRNAFWWIMAEMLSQPFDTDYAAKTRQLTSAGIAVWDVLYDCDRVGSLDSNIVRASERPNDIEALLIRCPTIGLICFNGGAARTIFKRHCHFDQVNLDQIRRVQLPSTSPAYASISRLDKLTLWRDEILPALSAV